MNSKKNCAALYSGAGVGERSHFGLYQLLKEQGYSKILHLEANEVRAGAWRRECALFAVPGGADRPYQQALAGTGNQQIREFVSAGGGYLGICAGAYYAAEQIEFDHGMPSEICEKRELGFFPGTAVGPAFGPGSYDPESDFGARIARLKIQHSDIEACSIYNGGCYFSANPDPTSPPKAVQVLAGYQQIAGQPPAIVRCTVGSGVAVLCGPHPECSPEVMEQFAMPSPLIEEIRAVDSSRKEILSIMFTALNGRASRPA